MKISHVVLMGGAWLALSLAGTGPAHGQETPGPQGLDHTDPPILIGRGGLVWYKAIDEHPDNCRTDAECDAANSDYPLCRTLNDKPFCVGAMGAKPGFSVFDDKGQCSQERHRLDPALVGWGTDWATAGDSRSAAHRKQFTLTGEDTDGVKLTLTLEIGDGTRPNRWVMKKNRVTCELSSGYLPTNDGYVPAEFLQLDQLRRFFRDRVPVAFAACKNPDCKP